MKKPCSGCGREIGSADRFCTYCGAMQESESADLHKDANPDGNNRQENQISSPEDKKNFSLIWLYLYLQFLLPLGMLRSFLDWISATDQYERAVGPVPLIATVLFWGSMLLTLITIIQGSRFKRSGYALLIFMFICTPFLVIVGVFMNPNTQSAGPAVYLIVFSIFFVIWTLPNIIYMNKRISLFGYVADTKAEEKQNITVLNIGNTPSQNGEESKTVYEASVQRNSSGREPVNNKGPSSLRMFIIAVLLIAIAIIYGSLIV